jgi:putative ABC transport system substrate-binding protein
MKRREFITLLGGAAAAGPVEARAQQDGRVRSVGMLVAGAENDTVYQVRVAAFREALAKLGWIEGRNLRTELRFGTGDTDQMRAHAAELTRLGPDVIVVTSTPATRALRQQGRTIPLVFTGVNDPVATGVVGNLAQPDGNATGFALYEPSIGGKWLELLKEAAPNVVRIAHIFDPANSPETYFGSIESAARALAVQALKMPVGHIIEIVRTIDAFAADPNGALLLTPDNTIGANRETIIRLAVQHRLPTIFAFGVFARDGGLMAYGLDLVDVYRRAAGYVDRILRGAKVNDLPVQFPTKFELVVNLKTAKAIGLTIPEAFLLRADEVIE